MFSSSTIYYALKYCFYYILVYCFPTHSNGPIPYQKMILNPLTVKDIRTSSCPSTYSILKTKCAFNAFYHTALIVLIILNRFSFNSFQYFAILILCSLGCCLLMMVVGFPLFREDTPTIHYPQSSLCLEYFIHKWNNFH